MKDNHADVSGNKNPNYRKYIILFNNEILEIMGKQNLKMFLKEKYSISVKTFLTHKKYKDCNLLNIVKVNKDIKL